MLTEDLTRTQIVQYAGASGDFNPLHTDEVYATKVAGYPSVFGHGMLTMALAGRLLTDWVRKVGDGWSDSTATRRNRWNPTPGPSSPLIDQPRQPMSAHSFVGSSISEPEYSWICWADQSIEAGFLLNKAIVT